jgi:hypothetical protein
MVSAPINRYINDEQLAQSVAQMLAREAGAVAARDVAIIPLYHQVVTWAMKKPSSTRRTPTNARSSSISAPNEHMRAAFWRRWYWNWDGVRPIWFEV